MVINPTISKILRRLEKYLIQKTDFQLGFNYDLIMIVPGETEFINNYSWIVSSKHLDSIPQNEFINEILHDFKGVLSFDEFTSVSRINKLDSNLPMVRNMNFLFPTNGELLELSNLTIGNIEIERAIIIHSRVLEKIRVNSAVTFVLQDGQRINAGIISIGEDFTIKHYTGKGLRDLFRPDRTDEEIKKGNEVLQQGEDYLIKYQYVGLTNLDEIDTVY